MAQNAAPFTGPVPAKQFIQLHWTEEDGKVQVIRFWGYARSVPDPLINGPRVDIEMCQPAIIGIPEGLQTARAQRKIERKKRRREDERVKWRRGVDAIIEGVAEQTADILARMREEERGEERAREEKIVEGHGDGGRDLDTTNEYNDFEFVRVPGQ